jgi:acetyltransferase-like isoleucine patch superfamily enzyme
VRPPGIIEVGPGCELSIGVELDPWGGRIRIGRHVFLGPHVVIYGHGGVEIGDETLISMHCCIVSSNHTIPARDRIIRHEPDILLPTKIGSDVWLGAGVKVLGGVTIGDGCVVGAGAVVAKDLPPYSIAVGVPARVVGQRN